MVKSVFNEHQCMVINCHLFTVDQCVSIIFHESYCYLMIFSAIMSDIRITKRSVSYNFGMENLMVQSGFNEHQCMVIKFLLFTDDQCVSIIFHESYSSYLIIFSASMSDIKFMKRSVFIQVFSYNFGMENLMVQSVFNEHQCMVINSHLFTVDHCVSIIFHESYSYLVILVPP